jgi:hypothetical protein
MGMGMIWGETGETEWERQKSGLPKGRLIEVYVRGGTQSREEA